MTRSLAASLLLLALVACPVQAQEPQALTSAPPAAPPALGALYTQSTPAVVRIFTRAGYGTGFLIAPTRIATAWHVVAGGGPLVLETLDGQLLDATLLTRDRDHDLAVLELPAPFLVHDAPVAPLALASESPPVGSPVLAIGHPNAPPLLPEEGATAGLLVWSLSEGIVGQLGPDSIQVTAAVDSGSSGGPLLNPSGEVLGVVTLRLGPLGAAARVEHLRSLLEAEPSTPRGPQLRPSLLAGLSYAPRPGDLKELRHNLALSLGVELSVADRLSVGVHASADLFLAPAARKQGLRFERYSLYGVVGPRLRPPFNPKAELSFAVQPYGMFGASISRAGQHETRLQWTDPSCDPTTAECAYTSTKQTLWEPRRVAPLLGLGVRFEIARGFVDLNLSLDPRDPAQSARIAVGLGLRF